MVQSRCAGVAPVGGRVFVVGLGGQLEYVELLAGMVEEAGEDGQAGKQMSWNGMDLLPMRDGLVARKDVYVDSMSFLRQAGASPP
ncbi:MAG TPA: hypothetical protein VEX18_21695 [Polyangiaceae bacterium]|nr:hypothetical protein [Polyangiaceae bacterium]